jgi:long-chain acyl-CoA synthetase
MCQTLMEINSMRCRGIGAALTHRNLVANTEQFKAFMPDATSAKWKAITGKDILEGYGLSETSPILTLNTATREGFSATVGLPFPSTDIKLLDAANEEAAIGEPGEICARGPQVMKGYWQKPDANAAAFTADGYFRTGDIGVFDKKGFLRIVDRKKDMIIVSGFNVYPNEVEAVAAACAGVAECACVGRPDEKTGEAVQLFVAKASGASLTEADVIAHCRRGLAAYTRSLRRCASSTLCRNPMSARRRRERCRARRGGRPGG